MTKEKKDTPKRIFNWWVISIGVISVIIGCFLNGVDYKIVNYYLNYRYQIIESTRHYAHYPLDDLTLRIPVIYDSDLRFPDFNESINIQTHGRLEKYENALVNIIFDIEEGELSKYENAEYPKNVMFMNNKIYKNDVLYVNQQEAYCELFYTIRTIDANDLPYFATQLLVDHVFVEELRLYYPGNFFKLGNNESYVLESQNSYKNEVVKRLLEGEKQDIVVNIYLVGEDDYNFEIYDLIDSDVLPWLKGLDNLFNFRFSVHHLQSLKDGEGYNKYKVEGVPSELIELPWISDIMGTPKSSKVEIKIVFYPYIEGGDKMHNTIVDEKPLYHSFENHNVEIPGQGVLYFTHLPEDGEIERADDFIWVMTRAILDMMGAPSHEMAFAPRTMSFKRVLIVDALTRFGKLLGGIKEHFESRQGIYDFELIELLAKGLKLRQQVIKLTMLNDLDTALALMIEILNEFNLILGRKQITTGEVTEHI